MNHRSRAFTLIEMLVVIGIIGVLIAILLPTLSKARAQSEKVKCMSNEQQVGNAMLIYAESNNGYLFPPDKGWPAVSKAPTPAVIAGTNPPQYDVWPYYVFNPHVWNPTVLLCPTDIDPVAGHSYLVNGHLLSKSMSPLGPLDPNATNDLKYESKLPEGRTPSDVIVMGEKLTAVDDYYMETSEFDTKVEQYRHGLHVGSNYLMLDMHVETMVPGDAIGALDPWDPSGIPTTQPALP